MASRGGKISGGGQLHMKPSFASDQVCDPGEVISPLHIPQEPLTASLSKNENLMRYSV